MKQRTAVVIAEAICLAILACGRQGPQELPVVVSPTADDGGLQWRDASGPLSGEVPWVLRSDLLGPATFLVVETEPGDVCVQSASFRVLAAGVTEYTVTLVSDLRGRVSWRVTYGDGKQMKMFRCNPRPSIDPRQECLKGGIPKPLFGKLVGGFSAELPAGSPVQGGRALRFERGFPCEPAGVDTAGEGSQHNAS